MKFLSNNYPNIEQYEGFIGINVKKKMLDMEASLF